MHWLTANLEQDEEKSEEDKEDGGDDEEDSKDDDKDDDEEEEEEEEEELVDPKEKLEEGESRPVYFGLSAARIELLEEGSPLSHQLGGLSNLKQRHVCLRAYN